VPCWPTRCKNPRVRRVLAAVAGRSHGAHTQKVKRAAALTAKTADHPDLREFSQQTRESMCSETMSLFSVVSRASPSACDQHISAVPAPSCSGASCSTPGSLPMGPEYAVPR